MKCKNIPTVKMEGTTVDSTLFKTLFENSKDRELTKRAYLTTKTQSFKEWNPRLDGAGEAIVINDSGTLYFINEEGQTRHVFEEIYFHPEGYDLGNLNFENDDLSDINNTKSFKKNFSNLLNAKKFLLNYTRNEIKKIDSKLKGTDLLSSEISALNSRKIMLEKIVNGTIDEIGLQQEVAELSSKMTIDSMSKYFNTMLDTAQILIKSKDVSDVVKAGEIASFIANIGSFKDYDENPLFDRDEIQKLTDEQKEFFVRIGQEANEMSNTINLRKRDFVINDVRNNKQVVDTFGKNLSSDFILGKQGLQDIGIFDSLFMDPMSTTFKGNGILPQYMMLQLSYHMNRSKSITKIHQEEINKLLPEVEEIISKLDGGKYNLGKLGILGAKGVSWEPFFEKDIDGKKTGGLVNRFSSKWQQAVKKARYVLNKSRNEAYSKGNSYREIAQANEKYRRWIKNNSYVFDITRSEKISKLIQSNEILKTLNIPTSDSYLTAKDYGITERHLNEVEEQQIEKIISFANHYEAFVNDLLDREEVDSIADLSPDSLRDLERWELTNSPFFGLKNYQIDKMSENPSIDYNGRKIAVYNNFHYNILIPKQKIKIDKKEVDSGYYNSDFNLFEEHEALYKFRNLADEIFSYVNSVLPPDKAHKLNVNAIPLLHKNLSEILFDPSSAGIIARLRGGFDYIYDWIKQIFGIDEPGLFANSTLNPLTGRPDYKVNAGFLNNNRSDIEIRFRSESAIFNSLRGSNKIIDINKYTSVKWGLLSDSQRNRIANLLNTNDPSLENITKLLKIGIKDEIPIGRLLMNHATNLVVETRSFNLHKTLIMFSSLAAEYDGRTKVKPIIDAVMEQYTNIGNVSSNRLDQDKMFNDDKKADESLLGKRANAIKQIESWYNRVFLNNYMGKEYGITDKKLRTVEEEKLFKELEQTIATTDDEDLKGILTNVQGDIGTNFTWSRTYQALLSFIRTKVLGWNIPASITNYAEGQFANEFLAQTEEFFDLDTWYRARSVFSHGGSEERNKMKALMEKYDILQDSSNIFQKAGIKSTFNRIEKLSPFQLTRSIEYLNQSPLMVALLMKSKVTNPETGEELSVWDAMNEEGHLKEGFDTEENKSNWENLSGKDYDDFKTTIDKVIVRTHGDYQTLRGIAAKEGYIGKTGLMFKGWLPQLFNKFFAVEHFDIETGKPRVKGWYRSHTSSSATLFGAMIGLSFAGLPGGIMMGLGLGKLASKNEVHSDIDYFYNLILDSKNLLKKMYGIPLNIITGKKIVDTSGTETYINAGFHEIDARNLQGNLTQMALMLNMLLLSMMVKSLFWDDDDDKDGMRRRTHNLLMNEIGNMTGQISMFARPGVIWDNMVASNGVIKMFQDLEKVMINTAKFVQNNDVTVGGTNSGESKLMNSVSKAFMPAPLKVLTGDLSFGFKSYMDRQFEITPLDYEFKSQEEKTKNEFKQKRAKRRKELFAAYDYTAGEVNAILREEGLFEY